MVHERALAGALRSHDSDHLVVGATFDYVRFLDEPAQVILMKVAVSINYLDRAAGPSHGQPLLARIELREETTSRYVNKILA